MSHIRSTRRPRRDASPTRPTRRPRTAPSRTVAEPLEEMRLLSVSIAPSGPMTITPGALAQLTNYPGSWETDALRMSTRPAAMSAAFFRRDTATLPFA